MSREGERGRWRPKFGTVALVTAVSTLFVAGAARAQMTGSDIRTANAEAERQARIGEAAEVRIGSFGFRRTDDGGLRYDGAQFTARIAHDGTVTFSRPWPFIAAGPEPHLIGRDPAVSSNAENTYEAGDVIGEQFVASMPGVRFDVTDEIMRLDGQDPARAEKASFLEATAGLRVTLASTAHDENERAAITALPARLNGLWHDDRYPPPEKARLLRAMWDELADGPDGDQARAVIRGFARTHLPPDEAAYCE